MALPLTEMRGVRCSGAWGAAVAASTSARAACHSDSSVAQCLEGSEVKGAVNDGGGGIKPDVRMRGGLPEARTMGFIAWCSRASDEGPSRE